VGLADIRAQIAQVLASVEGMGAVHEYDRYAVEMNKFLALFKDSNDRIHGWTITRQATAVSRDNIPTMERAHKFLLRGYYGLNDPSGTELVFQEEIERIQDAFRSNHSLNGTVIDSGPVQVDRVEIRKFGTVLCHYAELVIEARERVFYE